MKFFFWLLQCCMLPLGIFIDKKKNLKIMIKSKKSIIPKLSDRKSMIKIPWSKKKSIVFQPINRKWSIINFWSESLPRYNIFCQIRFANVPFLRPLSPVYAYTEAIKYDSNSIIIIIGSGFSLFLDSFWSDHYFYYILHNSEGKYQPYRVVQDRELYLGGWNQFLCVEQSSKKTYQF